MKSDCIVRKIVKTRNNSIKLIQKTKNNATIIRKTQLNRFCSICSGTCEKATFQQQRMLSKVHRLSLKNWSCTTWVVPLFLLVQYNRVLCWTHRQSAGRPTLLAKNGNLPLVRKQHSLPTDDFTSAILCPPNPMIHRHLCPSTTIEKRIVLRLSKPAFTARLHLWN